MTYENLVRYATHEDATRRTNMAQYADFYRKLSSAYFMMEPGSALFCERAVVTFLGSSSPADPFEDRAICTVRADLDPLAQEMLAYIEYCLGETGMISVLRGGGVYKSVGCKRLKKEIQQAPFNIEMARKLYLGPYAEGVAEKFARLQEVFLEKSLRNAKKLAVDGSLAIIGKSPDVGTGYVEFPKRRDVVRMVERGQGDVVESVTTTACKAWVEQLVAVYRGGQWPAKAAECYVPSFRGIRGGVRSDAEVISVREADAEVVQAELPDGAQVTVSFRPSKYATWTIHSAGREVMNTPLSLLNSPGLTTPAEQRAIIEQFSTPYNIPVWDLVASIHLFTTPPANVPWETGEEWRLLSVDIGSIEHPAYVQDNRLVIPKSGMTGGAESLVSAGVHWIYSDGHRTQEHSTGSPSTGVNHNAFLTFLENFCKAHGLDESQIFWLNTGDDLHIKTKAKYISMIMAELGPWMKCKGMKDHVGRDGVRRYTNFILGHLYQWTPLGEERYNLSVYIVPRVLKTVTSASQVGKNTVPNSVEVGHSYLWVPTVEAREQAEQFRHLYRNLIFYKDGTPEGWIHECLSGAKFARMKIDQELADPGNGYAMQLSMVGLNSAMADTMAEQYTPEAEEDDEGDGGENSTVQLLTEDVDSHKAVVIYAGISCGKTTAIDQLLSEKSDLRVLDTDSFVDVVMEKMKSQNPDNLDPPHMTPEVRHVYDTSMLEMIQSIDYSQYDIIFTNQLTLQYYDAAFVRDDPDLIVRIKGKEGDAGYEEAIKRWYSPEALAELTSKVGPLTVLHEGEFVLDKLKHLEVRH